jgi:long-chain acyl-CoA synthetase
MQTLCEMLKSTARCYPGKPAVVFGKEIFSYAQLNEKIDRLANGLAAQGVKRGDWILELIPNGLDLILTHFAIISLGAVVVPLNVMYRSHEINYIGKTTKAKAIIADSELWSGVGQEVQRELPDLSMIVLIGSEEEGTVGYRKLFECALAAGGSSDASFDDIASVIFTSGTTGRPKGATQTHRSILSNVYGCIEKNKFTKEDNLLCALPLFNNFALNVVMMSCFTIGGTLIVVDRFDGNKVLDHIGRYGATYFAGTPTMFVYLLEAYDPKRHNVSTLRVTNSGGAHCPPELIRKVEERFGVTHLDGYGQTEGCGFTTLNPIVGVRKDNSVGTPLSNIWVRIVDDNEQDLEPGEVGEIVEKGDAFSVHGYWNRPEVNREVYRNGWFHSGDLGYVDQDGYLYVVDRKQDLIITGGYNIYPVEVEDVLYTNPKVALAAVIGIPDPAKGEIAKAYIVLKSGEQATEDEIINFVRGKIAKFKAPRSVEFVRSLPQGPTGKILKRELRKQVAKASQFE